jgi:multidrug resistance efflux pump
LEALEESSRSQPAIQQAKLEQARALYSLRKHQLDTLEVKAQIGGVVQRLHMEVGQYAAPGTPLAVVAMPRGI